jgi:hypothetical protein
VSLQNAIVIGTVVALVVGVISSLATVQLIGTPPDRTAEIEGLNAEVASLEAEASIAAVQVADLEAEASAAERQIASLEAQASAAEEQVTSLETENAALQEQLAQLLNPPTGPSPTGELTVNWVRNLRADSEEVIVCVTIENTSTNGASLFYAEFQFNALDAADFVYPPVVNPFFLSVPLQGGELLPGQSRRGELPYVISPGAQPLTRLVWDLNVEGTGDITVELPAPGVYDNDDVC